MQGSASNVSETACQSATSYGASGVCHTHLSDALLDLNCDPTEAPLVLRDSESRARELLGLLGLVQTSQECRQELEPLLCVYLFGLCGDSGLLIQPTRDQCLLVRDQLCAREWELASSIPDLDIPDCSTFPTEQVSCLALTTESGSGSGHSCK